MPMYTQIKFSWIDNGKVQKLFILKLESDLDLEPKKVSEHGPWRIYLGTRDSDAPWI